MEWGLVVHPVHKRHVLGTCLRKLRTQVAPVMGRPEAIGVGVGDREAFRQGFGVELFHKSP